MERFALLSSGIRGGVLAASIHEIKAGEMVRHTLQDDPEFFKQLLGRFRSENWEKVLTLDGKSDFLMANRERSEFAFVSMWEEDARVITFGKEEELSFLGALMKDDKPRMGKVIPLRTDPYSRYLIHSDDVKFFFDHVREDTDFVIKLGTILQGPHSVKLIEMVDDLYRRSRRG